MSIKDLLMASSKSISASVPSDSQFNTVTTLIHGNGPNNAANNVCLASSVPSTTRNGNVFEGSFSPYGSNWSNNFFGGQFFECGASVSASPISQAFTVECWINLNALPSTSTPMIIMQKGAATTSNYEYGIGVSNTSGNYTISLTTSTNGTAATATAASNAISFVVGQWYHIAFVKSGSATTIYVNGVNQTATSTSDATLYYSAGGPMAYGSNIAASQPFNGYISNLRVVIGSTVYTSNFTVPTSPLTAITGTVLLTCQSNRFKDNSQYAWPMTLGGTGTLPQLVRFNPFGDGGSPYNAASYGGSCWFDGSTGYLSATGTNAAIGNSNFTAEAWVYGFTSWATANYIIDTKSGSTAGLLNLSINSGKPSVAQGSTTLVQSATALLLNCWNHIAAVRNGGTTTLYVNGASVGSVVDNTTYISSNTTNIGSQTDGSWKFNGYISDARIVNGTAIYTGNFTPPSAPLTAITGTVMLYNGQSASTGGIFDSSGSQIIETFGGARLSSTASKFGSTSLYVDGVSASYAQIPSNNMPNWGTANWTIEFWYNPTTLINGQGLFSTSGASATAVTPQRLTYSTGGVVYNTSTNGTSTITCSTGSGFITAGVWQHIAVVRSGATITVFVNGSSAAACTVGAGTALMTPTSPLIIGASATSGTNTPINGYIDDFRITYGVARYTTNFTVPSTASPNSISGDSNFNNVMLLSHFDGTNNTNNNNIGINFGSLLNTQSLTKTGTLAEGTFTPYGSNWSEYFNGTSYIQYPSSTNFSFGTSDFTIEYWIKLSTISGNQQYNNVIGTSAFTSFIDLSGHLSIYDNSTNNYGSTVLDTNIWHHVAQVLHNGTMTLYVDGVSTLSYATSTNYAASTMTIGNINGGSGTAYYISNMRVVKGTALYITAFTPPTSPLTAISGTVLLCGNSNNFNDVTGNNGLPTIFGTPQVTRFNPFGVNGKSYTLATNGGSCWLDGSTGYLTTTNSEMVLGNNNFTIEAWVYLNVGQSSQSGLYIIDTRSSASNGWCFGIGLITKGELGLFNSSSGLSDPSTTDIPQYAWTHVAYSRCANVGYVFVNGNLVKSGADVVNYPATTSINIGSRYDHVAGNFMNGYISGVRVVNGSAIYLSNFTPPTGPLAVVPNTALLYNAQSAGTSGIYDSAMQQNIVTVGNTQISTTQQKFGAGSLAFNGTSGAYLMIPNTEIPVWGSSNFTIECWAYFNNPVGSFGLFAHRTGGVYAPIMVQGNSSGLQVYVSTGGTTWNYTISTSNTFTAGNWYHLAFVRNGTALTVYVNGVYSGISSIGGVLYNLAQNFVIGDCMAGQYPFNGYIQDFRITYGVARYTSGFTPPTNSFPNQ